MGVFQQKVRDRIEKWASESFLKRLWQKDVSLWFTSPTTSPTPEIADRLGWLFLPEHMALKLTGLTSFSDEIQDAGYRHILLLGMGGSSLAPEVFQSVWGNAPDYPQLLALDSTHPEDLRIKAEQIDLGRTLILVASKSGTTIETLSLFRFFWEQVKMAEAVPGKHFVAITDPGSPLEKLAQVNNFRRIFLSPEDVGGRYSAFSYFGMVPAVLIGIDITKLLASAQIASQLDNITSQEHSSPGIILGAILGEVAKERNLLTILTSPSLKAFPDWLEQLIAESTGKDSRGIIPVVHEQLLEIKDYGMDRYFVFLLLKGEDNSRLIAQKKELTKAGHPVICFFLDSNYDLAQLMYHWEIAVASAACILGVHPFNQPDVQLSKQLTQAAMQKTDKTDFKPSGSDIETKDAIKSWLQQTGSARYVAIQAFLPRSQAICERLIALQAQLFKNTGLATTLGFGPRFLHSTGQLHKGGPNTGSFIQLRDESEINIPVPDMEYTFFELIKAQAQGDYLALKQRNRRVIQINLGSDAVQGLDSILDLL